MTSNLQTDITSVTVKLSMSEFSVNEIKVGHGADVCDGQICRDKATLKIFKSQFMGLFDE